MNPRKFLFLTICLLVSVTGYSQIDIRSYTTATDTFYWKRYIHIPKPPRVKLKRFTASSASKTINMFLSRRLSYLPETASDQALPVTDKEIKKRLFPIDINGDGLIDIIFSGPLDREAGMIRIWLNRKDSFQLVFEDYQYISMFKKEGGRLVSMQTADIGGDTSYLYFTRSYHIDYENTEPVFVRGRQTVAYKFTEEALKYFQVPIPFKSRADTMMLRASAAQQNEPFIPSLGSFGNIVAKYRSRSGGVALAIKSLGKGNNWYFVEMTPAVYPSASILYGIDKFPTFISGWVSGESIALDQE